VARSFNHILSYFRNSHDSPVKQRKVGEKRESAEGRGIEKNLKEEIDKFNKLKLQKQVVLKRK